MVRKYDLIKIRKNLLSKEQQIDAKKFCGSIKGKDVEIIEDDNALTVWKTIDEGGK